MGQKPILLLLVPYCLGILLCDLNDVLPPDWLIVVVLLTLLALITFLFFKHANGLMIGLICLLFMSGWLRVQILKEDFQQQSLHNFLGAPLQVICTGRVVTAPTATLQGQRAVVAVDSLLLPSGSRYPVSGQVLLHWRDANGMSRRGDRIRTAGVLTRPDGERNPGEFNYSRYLEHRNISGLFYVGKLDTITVTSSRRPLRSIYQIFDLPRAHFSAAFERLLPNSENAALLKALILGLQGEIQPETRAHFTDTGVVHILSVSGQHVGFVLVFLLAISRLLRFTTPGRSFFLMFSLLYYAGLTGFNPPVLRAVIMAEVFLLGAILQRRIDLYNVLAAAAFLILLFNPYSLFDVGFQLSFAAVFGMLIFYRWLHPIIFRPGFLDGKGWRRIGRWTLELVLISVAAQLGTLPMTAIYFERVPLLATVANLVVVPLAQVIVLLGFVLILVSPIWQSAAHVLGILISLLLTGVTKFVALLAAAPLVKLEMAQYSPFFILIGFVFLLIFFAALLRHRLGWAMIALLLIINGFCWHALLRSSGLRVTYLDVGQGDAAVVELPDRRAFLIDAGTWSEQFDSGSRTILPFLRRRQISHLEAIFISHSHSDHLGGVRSLLVQLPVKQIFTIESGTEKIQPDYRPLCDSLRIPLHFLQAGDILSQFSPLRIQVLSPFSFLTKNPAISANCRSLVLRLTYGENRFLFCGDVEHETEQLLLPLDSILNSNILKVPHHGSVTSNTTAFLQRVKPDWAVISVGKWNRFNQPAPATLARFADLQIPVVRTDETGAVIFVSDGQTLRRLR